ncbi:hypothetical protein ACFSVJ_24085 [Prauserella oleivorans]
MSSPLLVTEFLHRAREFFPGKEIVQYHDGEPVHRYTYRDYYDRVLRLAGALRELGCGRVTGWPRWRGTTTGTSSSTWPCHWRAPCCTPST